jgi:hypothetical protein
VEPNVGIETPTRVMRHIYIYIYIYIYIRRGR